MLAPIGPVWVFGPNNFPFAFNSVAGGDFAAAIAAGNPVIAKANSSHPGTTRLLAEEAHAAATAAGLPPGTVQLIYRTSHEDGERLVSDPRIGATGYTGSRSAGLALKAAADAAGKPIYLELSSVNPVLVLPGALAERGTALVDEFVGSSLMGTGQFCTNPSLVLLVAGEAAEQFIAGVRARFDAASPAPLLSSGVLRALGESVSTLQAAGASLVTGGAPATPGYRFCNTLLRASGDAFLAAPGKMQTEAFGNASLFVVARDAAQLGAIVETLEGSLTGGFYTDTRGSDDALYAALEPRAAPARRPPAQRQDAHRCRRLRRDEPRGPVPVDRPPRLHRRRHPRGAATLRDAAVLRQRATVAPARPAAGPAAERPGLPPRRRRVAPRSRARRLRRLYSHSIVTSETAWRGSANVRARLPSVARADLGSSRTARREAASSSSYCGRVGAMGEPILFQAA